MTGNLRWSVLRILRVIAEPVGRAETIGRPWLWRLRERVDGSRRSYIAGTAWRAASATM
jgi:hypothetical protein